MESLELREEIRRGVDRYFLQTSYIPEMSYIQSSFFREGEVFYSVVHQIEEDPTKDLLKEITKDFHNENKKHFTFLLQARDKVQRIDDPVPHLKLSQALARRNLHSEAIEEAQLAIEKGCIDSMAQMVIGRSWFKLGDFTKAYKAIERGIELSPGYPDLHNLMGLIYLKRKMCRMAVESFKRAISLNVYFGEPYLNLVRAYLLNTLIKQDYELSKDLQGKFNTNIDRAVHLNPFLNSKAVAKARKLFEDGKLKETMEALEEVKEDTDRLVVDDVILELYLILLQSGKELPEEDIERYLAKIREIIDQNPTFADAYNSLGILYTAKCKIFMDRAGAAFGKALEINSDYDKARKNQRLTENDREGIFILLKALLD